MRRNDYNFCSICSDEKESDRIAVLEGRMSRKANYKKWRIPRNFDEREMLKEKPDWSLLRGSIEISGNVFWWKNRPFLSERGLQELLKKYKDYFTSK